MPGTWSRVKTWSGSETLTAADLNAEFDKCLAEDDPDGIGDASASAGEMQSTVDPYPGASESLATSLRGELQRLRYVIKQITGEANWYVDPDFAISDVTATAAEIIAVADLSAMAVMADGSGFPGASTVYKSAVVPQGDLILTKIYIDMADTKSTATTLDIIGVHVSNPAHVGQITAAINGTIVGGEMICLEVPTTGDDDVDLYSATVGTGYYDQIVTDLTETKLVEATGAWTLMERKPLIAYPAANAYLYLVTGDATAGTYATGKFLIELWGI